MKKKQIIWSIMIIVTLLFLSYSVTAQSCLKQSEVAAERNDCLYIYQNNVFKKGTMSNPHRGNPCGTDITNIIPPSHPGNISYYLNPYYLKPLCQLECNPSDTQSCNTGQSGICSEGAKTCDAEGFWGACTRNNNPSAEICNLFDDDCDGQVDEDGVCDTSCVDSDGDSYGVGCSSGSDCNDNNININPGATEICGNNIDEDCSGSDLTCSGLGADTNGDGCVDIIEIQAYQVFWAQGQISIQDVAIALNEWMLGCSGNPNNPPAGTIINPISGETFTQTDIITIDVLAVDDVSVQKVEMYVDDAIVNIDFSSPYSYTLNTLAIGSHDIKAKVFDSDGASAESATITISVEGSCVPQVEVCNNIDDDCDAQVDEGGVCDTYCVDSDGDGYGVGCSTGSDCNDSDGAVHQTINCNYNGESCGSFDRCTATCPNVPPENCNNNFDDDCDGSIDEGCTESDCITEQEVEDETSDCLYIYQGDVYKKGIYPNEHYENPCGIDVTSIMRATHIANPGLYLSPNIYVPLCQSECTTGDEQPCTTSREGVCSIGKKTCDSNGQWSNCVSVSIAIIEICNNDLDDDCDGEIDELCVVETNPVVTISNSFSNLQLKDGEEIKIVANASDPEGISKVEFYVDGVYVGRDLFSPYEYLWVAKSGIHKITARARDSTGLTTTSSEKSLTVLTGEGACVPGTEICNGIDDDCNNLIDELESCNLDCLTKDEVAQERIMCLYIYNEQVFRKGLYPNEHYENPCGIDVTSIMRASHTANPGFYLNSNLYKDLCPDYYNRDIQNLNQQQTSKNSTNLGINAANRRGNTNIQENVNVTDKEEVNIQEGELISQTNWKLGRSTALLSYFFFALSTFIGVYRVWLIKRTKKRNIVIAYHKLTATIGFIFLFFHVYFLLNDPFKWGNLLSLKFVFLPFFSNPTFSYLAYGVFAFYFMVIGVVSGLLFKFISKHWSYKSWLWIHRLTYLGYAAIFLHALLIGTGFKNSLYEIFFILFFFVIISKYLDNYVQRSYKISLIEYFETKILKYRKDVPSSTVGHVKYDHFLIGKEVVLDVFMKEYAFKKGIHWFTVFDNTGAIQAYSWKEMPAGRYIIKGILQSYGETIFIEIKEAAKKK